MKLVSHVTGPILLVALIASFLVLLVDARKKKKDPHRARRELDIDSPDGEEIARFMNQRRSKLAEGSKRFKLKWAARMYKVEWNDKLASVARDRLRKIKGNDKLFFVKLPHLKKDVEIAQETIKYYWYELITHGIKCNEKKCQRKKVSRGDKELSLPYEMGFARALKIGCAIDYWKDRDSVKEAKKSKKLFRSRMLCLSAPKFNKHLYDVGKPCSKCDRGHQCDVMRGLCMTQGFIRRHPDALGDKLTKGKGKKGKRKAEDDDDDEDSDTEGESTESSSANDGSDDTDNNSASDGSDDDD